MKKASTAGGGFQTGGGVPNLLVLPCCPLNLGIFPFFLGFP